MAGGGERLLQPGAARVLGLAPGVGGGDDVDADRPGAGAAMLLVSQGGLRQSSGTFAGAMSMSLLVAVMASSMALRSGASGIIERYIGYSLTA